MQWFIRVLLVAVIYHLIHRPSLEGDTQVLAENAHAIWGCLRNGQAGHCIAGGTFPLYQLLPASLLAVLGFSKGVIVDFLAYLSTGAFFALLWDTHQLLSRRTVETARTQESPSPALSTLSGLTLLALVTGYPALYANSSFGEMLAAFLITQFVISILERRSASRIGISLILASWTKEIALPFLLVLGAVAYLVRSEYSLKKAWGEIRNHRFALLASSAFSMMAAAGLNLFRFGSPRNLSYLDPSFTVPWGKYQMSSFLGIWLSPSVGLLFFWTPLFVIFLALALRLFLPTSKPSLLKLTPAVSLFSVLAILSLGLSKWFAPYGWSSWGPRLILPWLPVSLVLLVYAYPAEFASLVEKWFRNRSTFWLGATVWALSFFPHSKTFAWHSFMNRIMEAHPEIPPGISSFERLSQITWPTHWVWAEAFSPFAPHPEPLIFSLCCGIAILYACFRLRLAAQRFTQEKAPPRSSVQSGTLSVLESNVPCR